MKDIEKVLVAGAGAIGCAVASMIHTKFPGTVSILADGERRERYRRDGFVVNGTPYDFPLAEPGPRDDGRFADLVVVAVKHHHLGVTLDALRGRVGPETTVLSLLNGIESEETIGAVFGPGGGGPENSSIPPYAMIIGIDAVRIGNDIRFASGGKIFFGERNNPAGAWSERVGRIARYFDKTGIAYAVPEDMLRTLWYKFMINVGINQVSAVLRAPYGVFQNQREAHEAMTALMREVILLSRAALVNLEDADLRNWEKTLASLRPDGLTSMCQDVLAGRKTEVEMFAGKVVELGKKYGIPTPANAMLFDLLRTIESNY